MSPAFLLLQYYDFYSSHSSYKNARVCMNYAEGLHFSAFHLDTEFCFRFQFGSEVSFQIFLFGRGSEFCFGSKSVRSALLSFYDPGNFSHL